VIRREWNAANQDRARATARRSYRRNQDAAIDRAKHWNATHSDRRTNAALVRNHGITLTDYERILEEQGGVCAACGREETVIDGRSGKIRRLHVDHNHDSGEVRGLLCTSCNVALGLLQDDADRVDRLAGYRRRYP
jgi:hypothetical protein